MSLQSISSEGHLRWRSPSGSRSHLIHLSITALFTRVAVGVLLRRTQLEQSHVYH